MSVYTRSITGRVREKDEDSVLGISLSRIGMGKANERALLALADGMGGGSAGEVASEILIECVSERLVPLLSEESISPGKIEEAIGAAISEANRRIAGYASENRLETMGTTACIAFVDGENAVIGNVGDSRAYIVNRSEIRQITRDHSVVQELHEQGIITKDEMRTHPEKNIITKAVGLEESITPDIFRTRLFKGDYLLLCCDGLWESMPELDMMTMLTSGEPERSLDQLIDMANALDGTDNISAVLYVPERSVVAQEELARQQTMKIRSQE